MPSHHDDLVRASRPLVRSSVFSAVAVLVSLIAHVAAGGRPPDLAGVLVALTFFLAVHRVALAGRERSTIVLGLSLAAAQVALHEIFGVWAAGPQAVAHIGGHQPVAGQHAWLMPAAHALGCLLLGLLLRQGESALWSSARRGMARLGRPLLRAALALAAMLGFPAARCAVTGRGVPTDPPRPCSRPASAGQPRRGPPRRPVLPTA